MLIMAASIITHLPSWPTFQPKHCKTSNSCPANRPSQRRCQMVSVKTTQTLESTRAKWSTWEVQLGYWISARKRWVSCLATKVETWTSSKHSHRRVLRAQTAPPATKTLSKVATPISTNSRSSSWGMRPSRMWVALNRLQTLNWASTSKTSSDDHQTTTCSPVQKGEKERLRKLILDALYRPSMQARQIMTRTTWLQVSETEERVVMIKVQKGSTSTSGRSMDLFSRIRVPCRRDRTIRLSKS